MKKAFLQAAAQFGVDAKYSGKQNKMFVAGDDKKVKSFIRLQCLKGKGAFPFSFGQA